MQKIIHIIAILIMLASITNDIIAQQDLTPQFMTDFPGGNILVEKFSNDTVYLKPDLRDTKGDWFYWYFGVKNAAGRNLTFQFADVRKMAAFGPAFSVDQGITWNWLYQEQGVRDHFSYNFSSDQEVRFCLAIPYLESNLNTFLSKHFQNPALRSDTLCFTQKGRAVEQLFINNPGIDPKYKVLIVARHHACEMMASYELEGIMEAVLSKRKQMKWLRKNVEFMIIPFVDKDGVEDGDQGKNRNGQDHNRDYSGESRYVETAAIRKEIPVWAGNKLKMVFDLHCPYVNATTTSRNETIFIPESGWKNVAAEQRKWMKILEENREGELKFRAENSLMAFGSGWNNYSTVSQGKLLKFSRWATFELKDVPLIATLEFPYAVNDGRMITKDNARAFGHDVTLSIAILCTTV